MDEMTVKNTKQNIVRILVMLFMTVFMVIPVLKSTGPKNVHGKECVLDDNWKVVINDTVYEDATLSMLVFELCNKGDELEYITTIPEDCDIEDAILAFYSIHSAFEVFLDGEKIYSYGMDLMEQGKLLGYGKHLIQMPDEYAGKELVLHLYVTEDNAFDGQQALRIVDAASYIRRELAGRRITLAISMFLIIFGILAMLLSVVRITKSTNFVQTFCISMFAFLVGCWTLCNCDLICFIIDDLRVKVYMEYMTFYLMPLPFIYYFVGKVREEDTPRWVKHLFWTIVVISVIFVVIAYSSQMLNIMHFPAFLKLSHLMLILGLMFVIILNVVEVKYKNKNATTITVGFAVAIAICAVELIRFNLSKYFVGFYNNEYSSTLSFAVLAIIIAMFVDFTQVVSGKLYKEAQQKLLLQLAYSDELTGLANRRKCEAILREYSKDATPYSVISFDLNYLKRVNDTMGHDAGDAMLVSFADILSKTFKLYGTVGRMGGDEFIAILPDTSGSKTDDLLAIFDKYIEENNSNEDAIKLSVAYGFATSREVNLSENDEHAAYRLADDRMYVNKRNSKKKEERNK